MRNDEMINNGSVSVKQNKLNKNQKSCMNYQNFMTIK